MSEEIRTSLGGPVFDELEKHVIIDKLIADELETANSKFPAFSSTHEGWAVLKEEAEELEHESTMMKLGMDVLWGIIKENHPTKEAAEYATQIRGDAVNAIMEAIQVAAMCDKFKALGKDKENGQLFVGPANCLHTTDDLQYLPGDPLNWAAKIVPSDTKPTCEVIPCHGSKEHKIFADKFTEAVSKGLAEHKCGNCNSYNWTPVSEHAVCMNPKNQKTETKATWTCPEWAEREKA